MTENRKARCPNCGQIFSYPYADRVNVILFGNWKKYHSDIECNPSRRNIR